MSKRKIDDIENNDPQEEFNQIKEDLLAGEPFYIKSLDENLYINKLMMLVILFAKRFQLLIIMKK